METELPSLASTDQGQHAFGPATDPARLVLSYLSSQGLMS